MKDRVLGIIVGVGVLLGLFFAAGSSFSQETHEPFPAETITQYRKVLETATDPAKIAEAHCKLGFALEKLGRETEATAEYLKIIINYPQISDINEVAEERLSILYSGFSDRSRELVSKREEPEKEKDPTIFFAYIKSLYENYRNLGQYKRALHVLQRLYDMDPGNQKYLVDMGNIYLHGYNDADKAIFHLSKAIEAMPNNPEAYVDLGRAFEKKDDYEGAIRAYTKAAEISPASQWAMYGLKRIDGIRLAREKRLVKDWYFIGPFDNSDGKGLEKVFPVEGKINFKASYAGKDGLQIKWFRPFDYNDSGFVDLNMLFEPNDYAVAYAVTYVHSPRDREAQFRFGSEDGIKVWLGDKEIFAYDISRSAEIDDDLVTVKLKKGWNKILVKVTDVWGSWGYYFRVTDLSGNPTKDLIFDPLKDDARLRSIYKKLSRQKRSRVTRIAVIYTVGISVFLLGIYFMISNIYGKIKINKMKEDFISSVSHELKTPISAVKMLAETLKRGKVKQDSRKNQYYDMMIRESDRLTRFINKILDFSKLEKGGKIFYFEKTNIVDIAKSALDVFTEETQDENLKTKFSSEKEEVLAEIDKDAIFQVVFNLIDNGYKYSKDKKEITVNVKGDGESAYIEIIDKGLGMPKASVEKIFEKFYRIERDIMKGTKGSGLGLAFVKSVITAHGGRIAVESELGKGSKFVISLPIERA